MKGPALVKTKPQIRAINIKNQKGDTGTLETSSGTYCVKQSIK